MTPCILIVLALASGPRPAPPASEPCTVAADTLRAAPPAAAADTIPRAAVVEYGEWYGRRLAIHRTASYTMVPLFVAQYAAGRRRTATRRSKPATGRAARTDPWRTRWGDSSP
ncbi:MAG TPA: hypothetical protein VGV85_16800 [Longimicrobiaceae bacterium]|nr:hypothetical protein [Longimicrobiaceae bacterium]